MVKTIVLAAFVLLLSACNYVDDHNPRRMTYVTLVEGALVSLECAHNKQSPTWITVDSQYVLDVNLNINGNTPLYRVVLNGMEVGSYCRVRVNGKVAIVHSDRTTANLMAQCLTYETAADLLIRQRECIGFFEKLGISVLANDNVFYNSF